MIIGDKKMVTQLYNFNQDIKNIYSEYMISTSSGLICGTKDTNKVRVGYHICDYTYGTKTVPFESYMGGDSIVTIRAQEFFDIMKEVKKNVIGLCVNNEELCIYTDNDKYCIGSVNTDTLIQTQFANNILDIMSRYNIRAFNSNITLEEDDVQRLIKNEYYDCGYDSFFTRISKQVLPGLKKTHKVGIAFSQTKVQNIFYTICKVEREMMTSYHIYKCVKFEYK